MQKLLRILFISDPQINNLNRLGCAKKMTEMRSKVWRVMAICMIISLKPAVIPFDIAAVGSGFISQDDDAFMTRIVENFHERKVVMTTHINQWHGDMSAPCLYTLKGWGDMHCVCGMV